MESLPKNRVCNFCNLAIENARNVDMANHKRWCKANPRFTDILQGTVGKLRKPPKNKELRKCSCQKCGETFEYEALPGAFEKRFCSRSCATASHQFSDERRRKIAYSMSRSKKICKTCGTLVPAEYTKHKKKVCSDSCWEQHRETARVQRRKHRDPLLVYRQDASFTFDVRQFPEEFDLSLIETFGWYKAKNRGDNQNGISRDHMVSVKYGFENNIPPHIIAHPANCKLMRHSKNVSKGTKNTQTLDTLLERIKAWDNKYS